MSIATEVIGVTPWRKTERATTTSRAVEAQHPDEAIGREAAQNRRTWAALERLGVREGAELPLHFYFETAGAGADGELARYFRDRCGYKVVLEPDGLACTTPPMSSARPPSTTGFAACSMPATSMAAASSPAGRRPSASAARRSAQQCQELDTSRVAAVNDEIVCVS